MNIENFTVANLSCDGCINTISKSLNKIIGVDKVEIDLDTNIVSVYYIGKLNRDEIADELLSLGYPEATEENGLLTQLKSYGSCLIGKLTK